MLRKSQYIALGFVALVGLIFLSLPESTTNRVKLALTGVFLPLFGLTEATQSAARRTGNAIVPREDLVRELEQLRAEKQKLEFNLAQAQGALRENEQLRQHAGLPARVPWQLKPARVIARDPANWWRTVFIDVGSRDGVRADMPVITPDGLVGRVAAVGSTRSQVVLLGDQNCRVAALVKETAENGIIMPYAADPAVVTLTYLSRGSPVKGGQTIVTSGLELKPGNAVLTSGLGGVFPSGIRIGEIVDVRNVGFGLYQEARVKLAVNLNSLDRVWVVVQ
ncbi:MAG: rod shape-determining protein MreC [Verrucomicrobia bacterium]|nr:rod shape-determining protein MreC [Verrucomicrobiota bacterium]